ncbi:U3 small nucleolar RNA-associated protein 15 homolog [Serendipita indica DSM 11827]|uniref:Related to Pwp2p n=1 Tax=Serendipita indica (strain DSM 11827) TaxID=1109443 RepID=G4TRL0_SERID|nr:U3 small nucleolar RNA-associated protein 15 homolog [Serendipita indica DSM 11827]CCA73953.1 related to Pwp2p [Serendipita indica DSM 11827]
MDYQRLVVKKHPQTGTRSNPETKYWRSFKNPVFIKNQAPVTAIQFSPAKPHRYVVTSGARVQIYNPKTQKVFKVISRFKDNARSGQIRADGKLIVAGEDTGSVQVFDTASRAILRTFDKHKQPTHVTKFSPNHSHILSCSDDTTVRLWDIPTQAEAYTFTSHTDYVRSGVVSTSNPSLILTGSYDTTVRMFDTRTGDCVMTMRGGGGGAAALPVEQVLLFPSGTAAISSSGPILRVWDLISGGRCIRALSNHQKTITSLAFDGGANRVLSAGLDQMVKVYDVSDYKVVHTMRYPAPLLSVAISPDNTHIAAGMSDGTLSIRRRDPKASERQNEDDEREALKQGAYEFFATGMLGNIGERIINPPRQAKNKPAGVPGEIKIATQRKRKLKEYDRYLKSFKYGAALDSVLRKDVPPTVTFSLIQELIHRDGVRMALSGRDDVALEPIIRLLLKHLTDPRFGETVCDIATVVIDMYSSVLGQSPLIDILFVRLQKKLAAELRFQKEIVKLKGALDMILATSALNLVD